MSKRDEYRSSFQDIQSKSDNITDYEKPIKDYIKDAEGGQKTTYQVGGKDHIGFGHLITDEEKKLGTFKDKTLSDPEMESLFEKDFSLKKGRARSRYGNREFDRLKPRNKALLIDYDFLGVTKGEKGGPTKLSQLMKSASPDEAILDEAQRFMLRDAKGNMYKKGTNTRRKKQAKMFSSFKEIEDYSPPSEMFDLIDQFHNGDSKEILNSLYPSIQADKQIGVWKSQLNKLRRKFDEGNFKETDMNKLEGIVAHQFIETLGGLD